MKYFKMSEVRLTERVVLSSSEVVDINSQGASSALNPDFVHEVALKNNNKLY